MRHATIAALLLPGLLAACGDVTSPTASDAGPAFFSAVSAGGNHACAIAVDGGAFCWGRDDTGDLGDGKTQDQAVPVRVARELTLARISAGLHHTCALTVAGQLYCWGWNLYGQLGSGGTTNVSTPVQVTSTSFANLSAGWTHTCALTSAGQVFCWGRGGQGQLGNGGKVDQDHPVPVTGAPPLVAISAGAFHTCGLTAAGAAYCWGANGLGQLGNGSTNDTAVPGPVAGSLKFSTISSGHTHTCAATAQGQVYCWGSNSQGEQGNLSVSQSPGLPGSIQPVPVVQSGAQMVSVSAGLDYTCGVGTGSQVYCWGRGLEGQLGNSVLVSFASPQQVRPQNRSVTFSAVSTGSGEFACGLTNGGAVYCWGSGASGELGVPNTALTTTPIRVSAPR